MRINLFRAFLSVFLLATLCVGCLPQPKPESIGYITVLTYNTHLFEGSRAQLPGVPFSLIFKGKYFIFDDEKRQTQIEENIRKCGADIVALQEVWADHRQTRLWNKLKDVYPYHFVTSHSENITDLTKTGYLNTSGLVLLSKYKFIGEPKFVEFDRDAFQADCGQIKSLKEKAKCWQNNINDLQEYLARKSVITATVELRPGATIRLGIGQTATGHDMEMVDAEMIAAETVRGETGGSVIDSPAIMMGDFNVHARWEGQFDRLKKYFAKYDAVDAYREVHPCDYEERMSENDYTIDRQKNELIQKFFKPSADPKLDRDRIDYVFVKKSGGGLELKPVEAEVIHDWKYQHTSIFLKKLFDLSDHYPVKVKFMVTRTTTPR
jgi:endonuclease/exonuclease/phosphatase family metal-dependent hydrolase